MAKDPFKSYFALVEQKKFVDGITKGRDRRRSQQAASYTSPNRTNQHNKKRSSSEPSARQLELDSEAPMLKEMSATLAEEVAGEEGEEEVPAFGSIFAVSEEASLPPEEPAGAQ